MKKIYGNNIFCDGKFGKHSLIYDDGAIVKIDDNSTVCDEEIFTDDDYVIPGFIDMHTHGAMNCDFAESSPEEIIKAVKYHLGNGVTKIMPTVTSSTVPKILSALENIKRAMADREYGKCIIGVHLEGPYLSQNQSGAQEKSLITPPVKSDYEKIISEYGDIIKRWDYAPERDENAQFCKYLTERDIIASAGHTDAKYDDMMRAKQSGCNLITHFYSCTSTITRELGVRKLGVIECGYLWDDVYIEIIGDGKHLPPELLRLIFKLKPNDKIILVSDSLKVAGSNEKYSSVGNVKCVIEDGVCKLLDRSAFAGSIASGISLIKSLVNAGIGLDVAIKAFTENPSKLLKLNSGKIGIGYSADFVILDNDLNVKKVIR